MNTGGRYEISVKILTESLLFATLPYSTSVTYCYRVSGQQGEEISDAPTKNVVRTLKAQLVI